VTVTLDAVTGRVWRGYADLRRRLTSRSVDPTRSFDASPRRDLAQWHRRSAAQFDRYRAEHPLAPGRVAVVCVSIRPALLAAIEANVRRQIGVEHEFVFVANAPVFDDVDLERHFARVGSTRLIRTNVGTSLGAALNAGIEATGARFIAKFDDDDWYGPNYLADSLRAHGYARAGVVGKHSYYADLAETGDRLIRFPGHEFRYSSTLAGGTLVVDRERTGDLEFADVSLGEDRALIASCHRRGISTFSADRFNFVQHRGAHNTWSVSARDFMVGCEVIDREAREHRVDR
jgi:Glycosyl transferase family 2